jgi:hypothetical protein
MIAEPYICAEGPDAGEICWYNTAEVLHFKYDWQPYADFEREKLTQLGDEGCDMDHVGVSGTLGYFLHFTDVDGKETTYSSRRLCKFSGECYKQKRESDRLLMRAAFLKAVCEKEGVAWLPEQPEGGYILPPNMPEADRKRVIKELSKVVTRKCDCHLYPYQVCDVCQGTDRPRRISREEAMRLDCQLLDQYAPPYRYTKAEVDERFRALFDTLDDIFSAIRSEVNGPSGGFSYTLDNLRKRFLS